jgi:hypothetical protein
MLAFGGAIVAHAVGSSGDRDRRARSRAERTLVRHRNNLPRFRRGTERRLFAVESAAESIDWIGSGSA